MDDPNRISITICGDGGCGKSSITLRLVRSQWTSEYDPTIEDSYSITRRIDGHTYHLSLTDTAGQEEYRGMWGGNNLRSDAFLMVYDITSLASLDALGYFNDLVDMEAETRMENLARLRRDPKGKGSATSGNASSSAGATTTTAGAASTAQPQHQHHGMVMPVKIVAGNKCDLQESRQVDAKTGLEWARAHGCGFMETSARNVVNIEETFALIVRRVVEARKRAAGELAGPLSGSQGSTVAGGGGGGGGGRPGVNYTVNPYTGKISMTNGATVSADGTRRAVTAPLSPLPVVMDEKSLDGGERRKRGFWRRLKCW